MFSSIRKYTVTRGSTEELTRRVREGFVPLVRRMKGFKGYYLINSDPEVLITVSVFETAEAALASNEIAADWVKTNVLESMTGAPEVIIGDVLISEVR
jgi:heme-degrading monooxygenase HmoA